MTALPFVTTAPRTRPPEAAAPDVPRRRRKATASPRPEPRRFRPDIEGLRAIAVVLVVVYHAGLAFPGGYVGVDVFFVISGFLITRQLVSLAAKGGAKALPTFYAHRIRRLLPAAAVVLVATVLAARLWAPVLSVREISLDAVFATFYSLNYRLAVIGTDYQHMGAAASPLQHFWSLGVEEQFYLVWPVVVLTLTFVFRRYAKAVLTVAVLATIAVSAWFSMTVTATSAPWGYFSLHTRAWELGVGAMIALTAGGLARIARPVRSVAAAAGLVMIVVAAFVFDDSTPFPGTAAWLPVGGVALVIAAGCGSRVPVERMLAEPLMQCLGKVSYSWYLWHWPILVIAPMAAGRALDGWERAGLVWLSLLVAIISFFLVEEPARRWTLPSMAWVGNGVLLSGTVAAAAFAVIAFPGSTTGTGDRADLVVSDEVSGTVPASMASAIAAGATVEKVPSNLTPQPSAAADSLPPGRGNGCHADFLEVSQGACVYGDADASRTVVLFGDSHMEQWLPAFQQAAKDDGWKVVSWTKSACPPADLTVRSSVLNRTYTECDEWRDATVQRIGSLDPDVVVVSGSETVVPADVPAEDYADAMASTVSAIGKVTDAKVDYLHDIPIPGKSSPECVAANLDDVRACGFEAKKGYSHPDRHDALAPAVEKAGATPVDVQPWFCTTDTCPAVVGNLAVYRDDSHMTDPYSRWLTPLARSVLADSRKG